MYFSSGNIAQMVGGQNALFAQNDYRAQQMAIPMGGMQMGGMGPPPPPMNMPPPPTMMQAAGHGGYGGGMAGERLAGGMMGGLTNVAMPLASGGLAAAGALGSFGMLGGVGRAAAMLDPFSAVMGAGRMGFGAMGGGAAGMVGGAAAAGAVALPLYAGYKMAQTYGRAFHGGMQDQMALNQTLRGNFQFLGGPQGQGFTQGQMGTIGGMVQQELNQNPFTNANELNQLISGGSQAGMFTGVRSVGEFSKKFRTMLDTLKTVQRELGGTLTEALNFVNESRQAGVFQQMDRAQFATQIRQTSQMTGMSRQDTMQMAIQGAAIARQAGGYGRQGAFGAMRAASTLGTALNTGAISEEALSEATGGLTGQDAIQSFTANMMQRTGNFLRRPGMGRFSLYALAGERGNLDPAMMQRFLSGDISVGEVSRAAHRNVRSMGRAQALNRAGELRGQVMEQGGMAGQIGMMRLMLGDRVMNQGSDISQLVMQRRFGMSRQEAEVMQGLMRNQGSIAEREAIDRATSARGARRERLVTEERSFDAVSRHISHSLQEGLGVNEVRSAGRRFVTRISEGVERMMNNMLGIYSDEMSNATRGAIQRAAAGQMSTADMRQMEMVQQAGARLGMGGGMGRRGDPFAEGLLQQFGPSRSVGERLETMGFDISGFGGGPQGRARRTRFRRFFGDREVGGDEQMRRTQEAMTEVRLARAGVVSDAVRPELLGMLGDREGTDQRLMMARIQARGTRGGGGELGMFNVLQQQGMSRSAAMAYMARQGMAMPEGMDMSMDQVSGDENITGGMVARDIARVIGGVASGPAGVGFLLGSQAGRQDQSNFMTLETLRAAGITGRTRREDAISFMAEGGHAAEAARRLSDRRGGRLTERGRRASAIAAGLGDISEEQLQAIGDDDNFRRLALRMSSGGPDARRALSEMRTMAMGETDPNRRAALDSLTTQAQHSIEQNGRVGTEFTSLVMSPRMREEIRAARREMANVGMTYTALGGQLDSITDNAMWYADQASGEGRTIGGALSQIGQSFAQGNVRAANQQVQQFVAQAARLDPEARSRLMGDLAQVSGDEEATARARALSAQISNYTQTRESLIGRGRGSRRRDRQRIETGLQMMGGLGMGRDFQVTLGEGDDARTFSGARAQRALQSAFASGAVDRSGRFTAAGGGLSDLQREALEQYGADLGEAGISGDLRREIMGAMGQMGTAGTREERTEAADRMMDLRNDPRFRDQFRRLDERQQARTAEMMRGQDPLGSDRNDILRDIRTAVQQTAENPDGPTPEPSS